MKKTKRIISALLSVCFILSITLIFSFATDHTMTAPLDLSAASADVGDLELDGYHWDNADSTLTLKDISLNFDDCSTDTTAINLPDKTCSVIIEGTNKITLTDTNDKSYRYSSIIGINAPGGISLSGSGTLAFKFNGNTDENHAGLFCGINTDGVCDISGSKITADASGYSEISLLLYAQDHFTVTDSDIKAVNVLFAETEGSADKGSTIVDSTVESTSPGGADMFKSSYAGPGLQSKGGLSVKNSTVNINTYGLEAVYCKSGDIIIDSSTVSAISLLSDYVSLNHDISGILCRNGNIIIKDSTVNAAGFEAGIAATYYSKDGNFPGGSIQFIRSDVSAKANLSGFPAVLSLLRYNMTVATDDIASHTKGLISVSLEDETVVQGNALNKTYFSLADIDSEYNYPDKDFKSMMSVTFSPDTSKPFLFYTDYQARKRGAVNASQTVVLIDSSYTRTVLSGGAFSGATPVITSGDDIQNTLGTPVKAGNTFAGWFYDPEFTKPVQPGDKYVKGMVLYAKWTVNTSANTNTVGTGDNTAVGAAIAVAFASISGLVFVIRKRTE
jgi:hypothetical protein